MDVLFSNHFFHRPSSSVYVLPGLGKSIYIPVPGSLVPGWYPPAACEVMRTHTFWTLKVHHLPCSPGRPSPTVNVNTVSCLQNTITANTRLSYCECTRLNTRLFLTECNSNKPDASEIMRLLVFTCWVISASALSAQSMQTLVSFSKTCQIRNFFMEIWKKL